MRRRRKASWCGSDLAQANSGTFRSNVSSVVEFEATTTEPKKSTSLLCLLSRTFRKLLLSSHPSIHPSTHAPSIDDRPAKKQPPTTECVV